jgi:broad specificity phosphatase PhoE
MVICYLIRHGETDYNRQKRCQGTVDIPMNELGYEQMRKGAEALSAVDLDAVYASPIGRAVESARIVANRKNLSVKVLDWLMEIDHGDLEGLNESEADARHPGLYALWHVKPHMARFNGGESIEHVALRCAEGLAALARSDTGRTVALVTHQVVIGTVRCLVDGMEMSELWVDKLINGEHIRRDIDDEVVKKLEQAAAKLRKKLAPGQA